MDYKTIFKEVSSDLLTDIEIDLYQDSSIVIGIENIYQDFVSIELSKEQIEKLKEVLNTL